MKNIKAFISLNRAFGIKFNQLLQLIILVIGVYGIKFILAISFKKILDSANNIYDKQLYSIFLYCIMAIAIYMLFSYLLSIFKVKTSEQLKNKLQNEILNKANIVKLEEYEKINIGNWQIFLDEDIEILSNFTNNVILLVFIGIIDFGLALYYGVTNSLLLTTVILGFTVLSMILPSKLSKYIATAQKNKNQQQSNINDIILDNLKNNVLIKTYFANNYFLKQFTKKYSDYAKDAISLKKSEELVSSVSVASGFFIGMLWLLVGAYFIKINLLTIGVFMGFMALSDSFSWPFYNLSNILIQFQKSKASQERLNSFLNSENEYGECLTINDNSNNLELIGKNLFYEYKNKKLVYNDFKFKKPNNLEIVGDSGTGKTTLMKMLMGLYQTPNIELKINNLALKGNEIYKKIAYVPQEAHLFTDTIYNNITYTMDYDVSLEAVKAVCEKVNANSFIEQLPNGYDSVIGAGGDTNLSTGQKQRISIARALLKNADLFFFDEITSALDDDNEEKIIELIKNEVETFIMITHKDCGKTITTEKFILKS